MAMVTNPSPKLRPSALRGEGVAAEPLPGTGVAGQPGVATNGQPEAVPTMPVSGGADAPKVAPELVFPEVTKITNDLMQEASAVMHGNCTKATYKVAALRFASLLSESQPHKEGSIPKIADALFVACSEGPFSAAERERIYFHAGPAAAGTRVWSGGATVSAPCLKGMALKTLQYPPVPEPGEDPKPYTDRVGVIQESLKRLAYFAGREKTPQRGRDDAWAAFCAIRDDLAEVPALTGLVSVPAAEPLAADVARRENPSVGLLDGKNREEISQAAFGKLADLFVNGNDADIRRHLEHIARFHNYSFMNRLLIAMQDPDATVVASRKRWAEHGYELIPGQEPHSIQISIPLLRPVKVKEMEERYGTKASEADQPKADEAEREPGKEETDAADKNMPGFKKLSGFGVGRIYDIRRLQPIEGVEQKDIYGLGSPALLKHGGDQEAMDLVIAALHKEGIEVAFRDNLGTLEPLHHGTSSGGLVEVLDNLPGSEKLRVLVHEWAHEILHQREVEMEDPSDPTKKIKGKRSVVMTRAEKELEADATACVVLGYLGVDSSEATWAYLRGYGISKERLEKGIPFIMKAADEMWTKLADAGKSADEREAEAAAREDEARRADEERVKAEAAKSIAMAEAAASAKASVRERMLADAKRFEVALKEFEATINRHLVDAKGKPKKTSERGTLNVLTTGFLNAATAHLSPEQLAKREPGEDARVASAILMEAQRKRDLGALFAVDTTSEEKLVLLTEVFAEELEERVEALREDTLRGGQEMDALMDACRQASNPEEALRLCNEASSIVNGLENQSFGKIEDVESLAKWISELDPGHQTPHQIGGVIVEARKRAQDGLHEVRQGRDKAVGLLNEHYAANLLKQVQPMASLRKWSVKDWGGNRGVSESPYLTDAMCMMKRDAIGPKELAPLVGKTGLNQLRVETMAAKWEQCRLASSGAGVQARALGLLDQGVQQESVLIGAQKAGAFLEIGFGSSHFRTIQKATAFDAITVVPEQNIIGFLKNGEYVAFALGFDTVMQRPGEFQSAHSLAELVDRGLR